MTVNVAVVDDGSVAIRGAIEVLDNSEFRFLGALPAAQELQISAGADGPVVLIADPFAYSNSPMTLVTAAARQAAVLIMSARTDAENVRQALAAGARGYISKQTEVPTLLAAVGVVGVGGIYLGDALNRVLLRPLDEPEPSSPAASGRRLTPREVDVLVMVADGFTHKQIASRLRLSKATVDTYVHRIRQKIGAVNKAGLTRAAMDLRLVNGQS